MRDQQEFYIDGQWVVPTGREVFDVINPATEEVVGRIRLGDLGDVNRAVYAARRAFDGWSSTSRAERVALLGRIGALCEQRLGELGTAMTLEMGCPIWLAEQAQLPLAMSHLHATIEVLKSYAFEELHGATLVCKEPIGVCALITPWNWPVSTMMSKLIPALAAGCTVVLKPSEYAPFTARILAEIIDAAGLPAGVFNLLHGSGPTVGAQLSSHPDVDMVSITGSTRAGVEVARNAAPTVKRVHQELGGKSPNIMLDDADLDKAVASGVRFIMVNAGQSCSVPSRMLVPRSRMQEALAIARKVAEETTVGPPDSGAFVGPVVNAAQWARIQQLIQRGVDEGAVLLAGGPGKPPGLEKGYYVRPTIFAEVTPEMTVAQEEIFGPVLVIQPYDDVEDAIRIANGTPYGLAAYVHGADVERARRVASRIRAGQVYLNGDMEILDPMAPFGGYKRSGNGREWGAYGFEAYLEVKAVLNYAA